MSALLYRLGVLSARSRWAVVASWLLVLLIAAGVALSGMRFSSAGFDVPGTDSSRALSTLESEFPTTGEATTSLQLVVQSSGGRVTDDAPSLTSALEQARAIPGVLAVTDPLDPARPSISADGATAIAQVTVGDIDEEQADEVTSELDAVAAGLRDQGMAAEIGGSLTSAVPEILGPTELVGALVAFLVLLLTFGSLVAAGANMLGALVGVGVGVLGILAFSAIAPIGSVTPILAVMLGLAVGIDYCLFVLSRFRAELRSGRLVQDAIGRATATAGSSVVFAGATVIIALVGLTVVGIPFLGEMGIAAAFAVAVAVLMSLTLLPALLSWMGRRALGRRERASTRSAGGSPRWTTTWIGAILRRPVIATFAVVGGLAVVALPLLGMQTSLVIPGGEDPDSTQRAAYTTVADAFGPGAQDPLVVLVRSDSDAASAVETVSTELGSLPNVATVSPGPVSADGSTAMLTVIAESGPLDTATTSLVRDIRALGDDSTSVQVTGSTAIALDSDEQLRSALIAYVALIVGLSFLLLVLLFRSFLVPLIATGGFLLSLGAALGSTVAVFQWGWLDPIVQAPQGNPLLSLLPIIVTGILFGLAMDYQVFLVSRIHEAHRHGTSPREAVRAGFQQSAPVVVAAAAIMAAVFFGFALSPSSLVGSIALALAVGVLADALLVRMILVPALLTLLGRSAWWIPRWLDKLQPTIDVEGAAFDDDRREAAPNELASTRM